ncbi:MAG: hypothetical protein LRS46_02640 [Desulfurococcales archaeon]|nr:hypothetical protein [Desulfurococcales archaeon]
MGGPFVEDIIEFIDERRLRVNGIGRPKEIELPEEVINWLKRSSYARIAVKELVTHYKFRTRLTHPGAIRSLLLLLYARASRVAPYRVARRFGVSPEQLYRLERGLRRDGLFEYVLNILSLPE